MQVIHDKFLVHTYYGKKKRGAPVEYSQSYRAFSPYFEEYGTEYSPTRPIKSCRRSAPVISDVPPLKLKEPAETAVPDFSMTLILSSKAVKSFPASLLHAQMKIPKPLKLRCLTV